MTDAFDLDTTFLHLGLGGCATPLPDFSWSPEYLAQYEERFADDGNDGRLVMLGDVDATWTTWERHPAGDEVVVLLSGQADLLQELPDGERRIRLRGGQAVLNPPGVWHTVDVVDPGRALFITPGRGTEHRPR